ncbi:MAG TPA: efflux RND transporter periplasmic adaptor subunit [Ramlibacter sp.]|uniref:efflux RND transporter periplasmic adaptor subunit n=1 Tax=Ramlibacter sp. TaxID=1917967 RepID=UPI002D1DA2B3|nr:efflux RND transporter periplasmic adaptor subunit [Ramlibacter sp.]HVZ46637.1 efflux RND transporter periplasmic adaptor subunit [Ramlibacter sp.]
MKRIHWRWAIAALVLLLAAAGAMRVLSARRAQQALQASAAEHRQQVVVELASSDVVQAQPRELTQGLPISGSLKAVNSAVVKARIAGELLGLTVREGDPVTAGQVIARVEETESRARLKQAQEQADSAKAQIEIAQRQWDNNKALVDQGFISKTALDTSWNNFVSAQANHQAALAAVEVARKALDDTVLRAPIAGIVSQRLAQSGERIAIDGKVVEIVDLSRLELEATLSATDSMDVRIGQDAVLQVEGSAQPVAARVVRINPSAQAGSRSVVAYLAIAPVPGLRHGLFAQGTLATGRANALAVPLAAVRTDKPSPYVQVVENGKVVHKAVEAGARGEADGQTWVAVSGLPAGAVVIRGHVGPLREGTNVKFTQAVPYAPSPPLPAPGAGGGRRPSP